MSIDYLEELEHGITNGKILYVCPGTHPNEWFFSEDLEELRPKAQRSANSLKMPVNIFRLVNCMDTVTDDSYLVVRKILDPGPRGEPNLQWTLVDTREAADMLRDVSQGPSPYFGAVIEDAVRPIERD